MEVSVFEERVVHLAPVAAALTSDLNLVSLQGQLDAIFDIAELGPASTTPSF